MGSTRPLAATKVSFGAIGMTTVYGVWDGEGEGEGYVFFGSTAQAGEYAQALANFTAEPVDIVPFALSNELAPADLAAALLNGISFSYGPDEENAQRIYPNASSNLRPHLQPALSGFQVSLAPAA